jgi:hypothetical protein
MLREKSKWKNHKGESTDAKYRDGITRSSDEAPVMGDGAKGLCYPVLNNGQPKGRNLWTRQSLMKSPNM